MSDNNETTKFVPDEELEITREELFEIELQSSGNQNEEGQPSGVQPTAGQPTGVQPTAGQPTGEYGFPPINLNKLHSEPGKASSSSDARSGSGVTSDSGVDSKADVKSDSGVKSDSDDRSDSGVKLEAKDDCSRDAAPCDAAPSDDSSAVKPERKPTPPQYVTKKFLVICLIITIILSTGLGAGIALLLDNDTVVSSNKHSNLSESDLGSATGSELTISEIISKNADSVVEIVTSSTSTDYFGQSQLVEGAGSGVIVNSKGYIVTNYHVIEGANSVTVTLHDGDSYSASYIGGDDDNDIAVIKINADDLEPVTLGNSSEVQVGDLAVAIGNPLGQLGGTATSGIISALDRTLQIDDRTLTLLQTDAAINPGNSGGGLFNGAGELIGIVDAKSSGTDVEGLAFAIPIDYVKDTIDNIISTGKAVSKPSIGIAIADVSEQNSEYYKLDGAGVYITDVTGSNAKQAGLKANDKLVSFNGKEITSADNLIAMVRKCKIGDKVTIVVNRNGKEITIKTKLEESSAIPSSSSQGSSSEGSGQGNEIDDFLDFFGF